MALEFWTATVSFAGEATLEGSSSHTEIEMQRDFYALGVQHRWIPDLDKAFWWGLGIEYDFGDKATVTVRSNNGFSVETEELALSWWLVYASTGWEFQISEDWFLAPQLKIGAVFSNDPIVYTLDLSVGGFYRF